MVEGVVGTNAHFMLMFGMCCSWISHGRPLPLVGERFRGGVDDCVSSQKIMRDKTFYGLI